MVDKFLLIGLLPGKIKFIVQQKLSLVEELMIVEKFQAFCNYLNCIIHPPVSFTMDLKAEFCGKGTQRCALTCIDDDIFSF
jgi:hypothetical protein